MDQSQHSLTWTNETNQSQVEVISLVHFIGPFYWSISLVQINACSIKGNQVNMLCNH
jgi:hypothetical protein